LATGPKPGRVGGSHHYTQEGNTIITTPFPHYHALGRGPEVLAAFTCNAHGIYTEALAAARVLVTEASTPQGTVLSFPDSPAGGIGWAVCDRAYNTVALVCAYPCRYSGVACHANAPFLGRTSSTTSLALRHWAWQELRRQIGGHRFVAGNRVDHGQTPGK
jgi:hypothetical protein